MSVAVTIDYEALRREPDLEAHDLIAYDATDQLLVQRAAELRDNFSGEKPGDTVVIGERHGAITLSLVLPQEQGGHGLTGVRVFQDTLLNERALMRNAARLGLEGELPFMHEELGRDLAKGAKTVLLQLPKSLDELAEIAYWVATNADPEVTLIAGGRVKHMTLAQNEVLSRFFTTVQAERAERKSRLLIATGPVDDPADPPFPVTGVDADLPFALHAYGATFGGPTLDHGSRLLLRHLPEIAPEATRIVDLGCGNGSLAVAAALARPTAQVHATDQSWAAVNATNATARWAGVSDRVTVTRADGAEAVGDGWAELMLVNPPFHAGQVVSEEIARTLIRGASRALAEGATILVVYNSHLGHRAVIEREIGPTQQVARDRSFTVVRATKR